MWTFLRIQHLLNLNRPLVVLVTSWQFGRRSFKYILARVNLVLIRVSLRGVEFWGIAIPRLLLYMIRIILLHVGCVQLLLVLEKDFLGRSLVLNVDRLMLVEYILLLWHWLFVMSTFFMLFVRWVVHYLTMMAGILIVTLPIVWEASSFSNKRFLWTIIVRDACVFYHSVTLEFNQFLLITYNDWKLQ